ncbi:TIGR04438 family Trp-rich protein [Variovorax rhizosphaerae]|uniref:TIGR04438 family Trp-rich protein n=1 Tax=Variovorax rhizosphaerae TaxID=1836200 RepID=A0ABU8WIK7_9BURK
MWFLLLGVLGVALKYFEWGPVASLHWAIVLIPFALAVIWWAWADWSGYTKSQVIKREDKRKEERKRSRLGMLDSPSQRKRRGK